MACQPPESYANPRAIAELASPLRERVAQLVHGAPTGGLVLVSGRRTPWQQWLLRHQRCPGRECNPACKGRPTTALPGRSKHQLGLAADLGGRELAWAGRVAGAYGLHRPVPGEPWHFEATDHAPSVPIGQAPAQRTWRPFRPGATDQSILAAGGRDNEVTELQLRLEALAQSWRAGELRPGPVDGQYGPRSQGAVTAFKRRIIELQRATGQEPWPNSDALVGTSTIAMLRWWTA